MYIYLFVAETFIKHILPYVVLDPLDKTLN